MGPTQLNTVTLSVALDNGTNDFTVSATTSITVGDILVCGNEAMLVQEIPVSGRIRVKRGVNGTLAYPQRSGSRCFTGAPSLYQSIRESATALIGTPGTYPTYMLPGQRIWDGFGNCYVLVDLTTTCYSGTTIAISVDGLYTGTPLYGGTSQGSVGLLVEEGTSNTYAWAQVYGYNGYAQTKTATTGITSAAFATATTTVSTPNVGLEPLQTLTTNAQYFIQGMFIVGGGSSAVTSATSSTGYAVPVFLNFPWIYNALTSMETSNS